MPNVNYCVRDAATKIVKRLVLSMESEGNPAPALNPGEDFIEVPLDFDNAVPAGKQGPGWLTLADDGTKGVATAEARDAALTPPLRPEVQAVKDALAQARASGAALIAANGSPELRAFLRDLNGVFVALEGIYRARPHTGF